MMAFSNIMLKKIVNKTISRLIYFSGIYFVLNKAIADRGIYILMYHRIAAKDDRHLYQDYSVAKDELIKQLTVLKKHYTYISMSEAVDIIQGNSALDKDYLVITFDDGYADNAEHGRDIFIEFMIKPIVYLTANKIEQREPIWTEIVDYLLSNANLNEIDVTINETRIFGSLKSPGEIFALSERVKTVLKELTERQIISCLSQLSRELDLKLSDCGTELMNWPQVRELIQAGCEIGGHTMNHLNLNVENEGTIKIEIEGCRKLLEKRTGAKIEHFAYPYGKKNHFNQGVADSLKLLYKSAVTTDEGLNSCGCDVFRLKRIAIANHHRIIDIKIKMLRAKMSERLRLIKRLPGCR